MPTRGPRRSRMRSKVARPLTAATRPDISAKTQIPTTPTTVAQASDRPKRAPTCAFVTRSPMSTKPPIAVRIPKATAKTFFTRSPPHRRLGPGQTVRHVRQLLRQPRVLRRVPTYQRNPYVREEITGVGHHRGHPAVRGIVLRLGLFTTEVVGGPAGVGLAVEGDDLLVLAEHPSVLDQLEHERHRRHVAAHVLERQVRLVAPRRMVRRLRCARRDQPQPRRADQQARTSSRPGPPAYLHVPRGTRKDGPVNPKGWAAT